MGLSPASTAASCLLLSKLPIVAAAASSVGEEGRKRLWWGMMALEEGHDELILNCRGNWVQFTISFRKEVRHYPLLDSGTITKQQVTGIEERPWRARLRG